MTVVGDKELIELMKRLPESASDRIVGQAYMRAAKPLIEAEKRIVPKGRTRNLVNSIGAYRTPKRQRTAVGEVRVGPRRKGKYKGFAGHLVEFGTKPRKTKGGANRGVMPSHPFVAPAFRTTNQAVLNDFIPQMRTSFLRNMKRYAKKGLI